MMIDECIKRAEEVAEQNEWFEKNFLENMQYKERAEEQRQLAEWLKDYKRLKEQEPCEMTVEEYRQRMIQAFEAIENLPLITPVACIAKVIFDKDYIQELVDKKVDELVTRKKGKWIIDDEEHGRIWHCHCSNCKKDPQDHIGGSENWWLVRLPKYCPTCGIEMQEVEE